MKDGEFEWDDAKAAANLVRHGVAFETARLAFRDVFAIEREDHRKDYGEDRYTVTGMAETRLLTVAYTMRGSRIRIIMARYAEPLEQHLYHEENGQN